MKNSSARLYCDLWEQFFTFTIVPCFVAEYNRKFFPTDLKEFKNIFLYSQEQVLCWHREPAVCQIPQIAPWEFHLPCSFSPAVD